MRRRTSVLVAAVVLTFGTRLHGGGQGGSPVDSILQMPASVAAFVVAMDRDLAAAITMDHTIRVLSLSDGREQRAIQFPPGPGDVFSISPDGRFIVLGDHKGNVHIWASDTGADAVRTAPQTLSWRRRIFARRSHACGCGAGRCGAARRCPQMHDAHVARADRRRCHGSGILARRSLHRHGRW